jgi:hypothetical protein
MAGETDLVISGDGVPPYSARGLRQTLEPIAVVAPARTVNGGLVNLAPAQFRKYKSTLSCTDWDQPAFAGLWPGSIITVDCVEEVGYKTVGGAAPEGRTIIATRVSGDYTFARMRLSMMVMGPWTQDRSETGGSTAWQIELEEI